METETGSHVSRFDTDSCNSQGWPSTYDLPTAGFFVFRLGNTLGEWQILLLPAFVYLHLLGCGWNWPIKASHPFQLGGLLLPKRGQRVSQSQRRSPCSGPAAKAPPFQFTFWSHYRFLAGRKPSEEDRRGSGHSVVLTQNSEISPPGTSPKPGLVFTPVDTQPEAWSSILPQRRSLPSVHSARPQLSRPLYYRRTVPFELFKPNPTQITQSRPGATPTCKSFVCSIIPYGKCLGFLVFCFEGSLFT